MSFTSIHVARAPAVAPGSVPDVSQWRLRSDNGPSDGRGRSSRDNRSHGRSRSRSFSSSSSEDSEERAERQ
eukprot:1088410-Prymnesium_polylepis.2